MTSSDMLPPGALSFLGSCCALPASRPVAVGSAEAVVTVRARVGGAWAGFDPRLDLIGSPAGRAGAETNPLRERSLSLQFEVGRTASRLLLEPGSSSAPLVSR